MASEDVAKNERFVPEVAQLINFTITVVEKI